MVPPCVYTSPQNLHAHMGFEVTPSSAPLPFTTLLSTQSVAVAVIIAVADSDDGFRLVALETLCELALINNVMVAQLGGFAVRLPSPHTHKHAYPPTT